MKQERIRLAFFAAALAIALASCNGNGTAEQAEEQKNESLSPQQKSEHEVFTQYIELKDALVETNAEKAKAEAQDMKDALGKLDTSAYTADQKAARMEKLQQMQANLNTIIAAPIIAEQREAFEKVSDAMYASIKELGFTHADAYWEYCPMAFDNKGAHWISTEEEIKNPYFGQRMMTCGEVKEKLK